jgi:hypothetical protein
MSSFGYVAVNMSRKHDGLVFTVPVPAQTGEPYGPG